MTTYVTYKLKYNNCGYTIERFYQLYQYSWELNYLSKFLNYFK